MKQLYALIICALIAAFLGCAIARPGADERTPAGMNPELSVYRSISFNGEKLLIGNHLWDIKTGLELRPFSVSPQLMMSNNTPYGFGSLEGAKLSPDGKTVLTATVRDLPEGVGVGPVQLWNVATGQEIHSFVPGNGRVEDVEFSPDGKFILTALFGIGNPSSDCTIHILEVSSGKWSLVMQCDWLPSETGPVLHYASFSADSRKLAVISRGKVTIFDSRTWKPLCVIHAEKQSSFDYFVQFSPDGKLLLIVDDTRTTTIWSATTGQFVQAFFQKRGEEAGFSFPYAAFAPNSWQVFSASANGIAILWDVKSGKEIRRFQIPGTGWGTVDEMIISRDGTRLMTLCTPNTNGGRNCAALWDVQSGQLITQFSGHERIVGFSPVDEAFVTIKDAKPSALWSGVTGKRIRTFQ